MPEVGAGLVLQGRQGAQVTGEKWRGGRSGVEEEKARERRAGPGASPELCRTPACSLWRANHGRMEAEIQLLLHDPNRAPWFGSASVQSKQRLSLIPIKVLWGPVGFPRSLTSTSSEKGSHWRTLSRRVHDLAYVVPGWPKAICFLLKNKDISSYGSRVKKQRVVVIGQCALTGTGVVGYFWALSWLKFPKSLINTTWSLSPSTKLDFCHHLKNDWISTYTSKPLL